MFAFCPVDCNTIGITWLCTSANHFARNVLDLWAYFPSHSLILISLWSVEHLLTLRSTSVSFGQLVGHFVAGDQRVVKNTYPNGVKFEMVWMYQSEKYFKYFVSLRYWNWTGWLKWWHFWFEMRKCCSRLPAKTDYPNWSCRCFPQALDAKFGICSSKHVSSSSFNILFKFITFPSIRRRDPSGLQLR
jgi:hypothetical protein